jgi:hypothetical protein
MARSPPSAPTRAEQQRRQGAKIATTLKSRRVR